MIFNEFEARLREHAQVRDAVVQVCGEGVNKYLVGYVMLATSTPVSTLQGLPEQECTPLEPVFIEPGTGSTAMQNSISISKELEESRL